jgi:hypothetical protein
MGHGSRLYDPIGSNTDASNIYCCLYNTGISTCEYFKISMNNSTIADLIRKPTHIKFQTHEHICFGEYEALLDRLRSNVKL